MDFEYDLKNKKVLVVILVIVLLGGGMYFIWSKSLDRPGGVACTLEAKLCPDGSYVGRTGPNCEFSACQKINEDGLLETYNDSLLGVTFEYPKQLVTKYISLVDWPPKITIKNIPFICNEFGNEIMINGETKKKIIGGETYCVTKESEGAAGSVYTNYTYTTLKDDRVITFVFNLRVVQCANYDDPQKTECDNERESFNVDDVIKKIADSVVFE